MECQNTVLYFFQLYTLNFDAIIPLSFRDCFQYHHLVPLKGNFFGTLISYIKQCSILCNVYTSLHIKHIIRGWLLVSKVVQGLYKVPLNCIASRLLLGKKGIHMLSMDEIFPIIFHVHLVNTQVKKSTSVDYQSREEKNTNPKEWRICPILKSQRSAESLGFLRNPSRSKDNVPNIDDSV